MKLFSKLLLSLHQGALEKPAGDFKNWALHESKSLIPFDSCVWGTGSWIAGQQPTVHSVHLHNLDAGFVANWMRYQHEDTLAAQIYSNMGQTFNVDAAAAFAGTPIYEFHCKRFDMAHIIATVSLDADTQLLNSMSWYRSDINAPFSEVERALKEALFPHLVLIAQANLLVNLPHLPSAQQPIPFNSTAVCDNRGVLQVAMPSLVESLRMEWPSWKGPVLPECILESLRQGAPRFNGKHIAVCLSQLEELLLVRARPLIAADQLSERELEVAHRYAAGEDYKTIAQMLSISPSTIKVHLNKIYTKLDIKEKTALVSKLRQLTD